MAQPWYTSWSTLASQSIRVVGDSEAFAVAHLLSASPVVGLMAPEPLDDLALIRLGHPMASLVWCTWVKVVVSGRCY